MTYDCMSLEEQKRVAGFHFEADRKRTLVGQLLARQAASRWSGVPDRDLRFARNEQGKPYAVGLPVEFSIRHSEDPELLERFFRLWTGKEPCAKQTGKSFLRSAATTP